MTRATNIILTTAICLSGMAFVAFIYIYIIFAWLQSVHSQQIGRPIAARINIYLDKNFPDDVGFEVISMDKGRVCGLNIKNIKRTKIYKNSRVNPWKDSVIDYIKYSKLNYLIHSRRIISSYVFSNDQLLIDFINKGRGSELGMTLREHSRTYHSLTVTKVIDCGGYFATLITVVPK